MCVAVPGKIEKIEGSVATVKVGEASTTANLDLIGQELQVGDYILVHAGFAINRIDREEAEEIEAIMEEIGQIW
ncbi:MAG: HypC/HybG/HupF family hydrogenase formation chaperone [Armatimonadota bacterium]